MSIHPQTRMGPVRLKVADAERMLAFYQEVMGLAVLGEVDGAMALGVGEMPLIELMAHPGARWVGGVTGLFHVALLVPSARDLGTWLAHLKQAGWPLAGASDHGVSKALYLSDLEGNGIEVYCDREQGWWPFVDGRLQIVTERLDLERLLALAEGGDFAELAEGPRVGHVHLKAAEVSACERFYCDILGFELMQRYGAEASFVAAGGYHHHLAFNIWQSKGAPPPPEDATGLVHYAIVMPEGMEEVRGRLEGAGCSLEQLGEGWLTRDPAGNALRLEAA